MNVGQKTWQPGEITGTSTKSAPHDPQVATGQGVSFGHLDIPVVHVKIPGLIWAEATRAYATCQRLLRSMLAEDITQRVRDLPERCASDQCMLHHRQEIVRSLGSGADTL